jgi:hypothetical protein
MEAKRMNIIYVIGADLVLALVIILLVVFELERRERLKDLNMTLKIKAQSAENAKKIAAMSQSQLDADLAKRFGRSTSKPPAGKS